MRVFVTGATGFIGSAIVRELVDAGHDVTGLARSDAAAEALAGVGVQSRRGSLADLDALREGAAAADGVVHNAFTNVGPDVDFASASQADAEAITALGAGLAGSGKPLVITSGTALVSVPGRAVTEADVANWGPRVAGELAALPLADQDVRISVVRLPLSVHDGRADTKGFVPELVRFAKQHGRSPYPGAGVNRWSAVHRDDAARLFRLALVSAPAGAVLHGVGDTGIPFRQIAEAIAVGIGVPSMSVSDDEAETHFGYLTPFVGLDNWTTGDATSTLLGWKPEGLGLLADIADGGYLAR